MIIDSHVGVLKPIEKELPIILERSYPLKFRELMIIEVEAAKELSSIENIRNYENVDENGGLLANIF